MNTNLGNIFANFVGKLACTLIDLFVLTKMYLRKYYMIALFSLCMRFPKLLDDKIMIKSARAYIRESDESPNDQSDDEPIVSVIDSKLLTNQIAFYFVFYDKHPTCARLAHFLRTFCEINPANVSICYIYNNSVQKTAKLSGRINIDIDEEIEIFSNSELDCGYIDLQKFAK